MLGVAVCTGGANTDLTVGNIGGVVDNSGGVGSELLGSDAGQMNLLF